MNQVVDIISSTDSPKGRRHENTGKKTFLTMVQDHALINLILTEYSQGGMTDADFAKYAEDKLKIPAGTIKDHTVKMRRDQFKIANNKSVFRSASDPGAMSAMVLAHEQKIASLEERLALLEGWINSTFPLRNGKKAI